MARITRAVRIDTFGTHDFPSHLFCGRRARPIEVPAQRGCGPRMVKTFIGLNRRNGHLADQRLAL